MPVDVFPEFAPPRVEIQTPSLGLSAEEVESLVTVPLEQALNGVDGLELMRSKSVPDLSSIELLFKPGTDELRARQLVQERVATVVSTLPTWAAPPVMMPPVSATGRVMKIGMSSKNVSLIDMSMIAYWTIRARLLRVPGVANVAIWGERIKMPQVQVDPERMRAHDVSLDEVMETTADALDVGILQFSNGAVIGTGGFIETPNQRLGIRPRLGRSSSAEDLAQVPIGDQKKSDGTPLRLSDVANVVEDTWPLIRRRGHQRRSRAHARRREVPVGQHAGGDAGRRRGARRAAPWSARYRDRLDHLPAGGLHPGRARQSHPSVAHRVLPGDAGASSPSCSSGAPP